MRALTIIPARGGSRGIPRKNLAPIAGHPLIRFTIEAALAAGVNGRVCLSTDDEAIADYGRQFAIEVPFLRPASLATDTADTMSVVRHCLDWYATQEDFQPDAVILLQPTTPFRTAADVTAAWEQFQRSGRQSLIAVNLVDRHPCEYIVDRGDRFDFVMTPPATPGRQAFPEVLFINGAIYITAVGMVRDAGQFFDDRAALYRMAADRSLDIDEPVHLDLAHVVFQRQHLPWAK